MDAVKDFVARNPRCVRVACVGFVVFVSVGVGTSIVSQYVEPLGFTALLAVAYTGLLALIGVLFMDFRQTQVMGDGSRFMLLSWGLAVIAVLLLPLYTDIPERRAVLDAYMEMLPAHIQDSPECARARTLKVFYSKSDICYRPPRYLLFSMAHPLRLQSRRGHVRRYTMGNQPGLRWETTSNWGGRGLREGFRDVSVDVEYREGP